MTKEEALEALQSPLFKDCILRDGKLKDIELLTQERYSLILTFKYKSELRLFYEALMLVLYDQPSSLDYQYFKSLKDNLNKPS